MSLDYFEWNRPLQGDIFVLCRDLLVLGGMIALRSKLTKSGRFIFHLCLVIDMSVRSFIFPFLTLYLIFTPVTAEEEPLDINITFPAFYEVNISGALAKNIGVAGLGYPVTVNVSSADKEVNLTTRSLEV
jgi:hypothetical protein